MALVEKTSSKKLVKNAWNLSKCAFSTSSVKYVVELEAYPNTDLRHGWRSTQIGIHYTTWKNGWRSSLDNILVKEYVASLVSLEAIVELQTP